MLKVENVRKKYGDLVAVDNLSFEVADGEIFGLLGLNGAGTSALAAAAGKGTSTSTTKTSGGGGLLSGLMGGLL